jgi:hypothetical protein
VQFTGNFLLYIFDLFGEGLGDHLAFLGSAIEEAVWSFDPAEGRCEVDCKCDVLSLLDERDDVGDILLVADFLVFGILING